MIEILKFKHIHRDCQTYNVLFPQRLPIKKTQLSTKQARTDNCLQTDNNLQHTRLRVARQQQQSTNTQCCQLD